NGKDLGSGPNVGPEKDGKLAAQEKREKRQKRWKITFSNKSGADYARELQYFGATVAIPTGEPSPERAYLTLKQLAPPGRPEYEDVGRYEEIFWIGEEPSAIAKLCGHLGLRARPQFIAVFFPLKFESRLVALETSYRRKTED